MYTDILDNIIKPKQDEVNEVKKVFSQHYNFNQF